ncbi:unnamed protein product [Trichobilharzia regenti]|nr:unnamed protein product [Trichobilharzia regenti]
MSQWDNPLKYARTELEAAQHRRKQYYDGKKCGVSSDTVDRVCLQQPKIDNRCQKSVLCGLYEKRLLKYLFDPTRPDAHNPIERPSANDTQTLNVSVKFFLNQVMDVVSAPIFFDFQPFITING